MKTNQIMIRPMGEFKVVQRTKDAFFNATELLKQWNQLKGMRKEVNDYFDLSSTKEFIYTIMKRENYDTGNYPYHKSRANKGDNAGTWMHPLLFIDFAMWINPSFKYDVLKFVYDEMIKFRNLAGDAYPRMCTAFVLSFQRRYLSKKLVIWQNHSISLCMANMNQKCVIRLAMRLRYVRCMNWNNR